MESFSTEGVKNMLWFSLTLSMFIVMVAVVYQSITKKYLQSDHVIQMFEAHDNCIPLNKEVSLVMNEHTNQESHEKSFIIELIVAGKTIDTTYIDRNTTSFLAFDGPWNDIIAKQFVRYSKKYHKRQIEVYRTRPS